MSKLAVSVIESIDATTDLLIGSANTNSGNVRIVATNNTIIFSGNPVFTNNLPGLAVAFDQANTAYNQANAAFAKANTAYDQANAAFAKANTAASTGKAIAMVIVFG